VYKGVVSAAELRAANRTALEKDTESGDMRSKREKGRTSKEHHPFRKKIAIGFGIRKNTVPAMTALVCIGIEVAYDLLLLEVVAYSANTLSWYAKARSGLPTNSLR
jgi:hypothetical protein